jgi:dipeptidyl aminopeptidase/acylaminoacyl peptidase
MEGECGDLHMSSGVQAVVNIGGPTDLANYFETSVRIRYYLIRFVGGPLEEIPEAYKLASPITFVSEGDSPVLSVHGDQTIGLFTAIPPQQAKLLDKKMKEIGVSHTLILLEGESGVLDIAADYPVWDFFDKHLKGRN